MAFAPHLSALGFSVCRSEVVSLVNLWFLSIFDGSGIWSYRRSVSSLSLSWDRMWGWGLWLPRLPLPLGFFPIPRHWSLSSRALMFLAWSLLGLTALSQMGSRALCCLDVPPLGTIRWVVEVSISLSFILRRKRRVGLCACLARIS